MKAKIGKTVGWMLLGAAVAVAGAGCGASPRWAERVEAVADASGFARLGRGGAETMIYVSTTDPTGGNADYNHFVRPSDTPGWVVLAELDGPGIMDRFWMTGVDPGYRMKLFVDDEKMPRLEGPVEELWGGERRPWTPPFSAQLNQCWWSYVPVTFAKKLRIEGQIPPTHRFWGPRRLYVQLGGRRLQPAALGETLPEELGKADEAALARAGAALEASMQWQGALGLDGPEAAVAEIAPGETATLWERGGEGVLQSWAIRVEPAGECSVRERLDLSQQAVLEARYGSRADAAPSVSVPLADFFCNAWGKRNHSSLAMRVNDEGSECRLPMPFRDGMRISLANRSALPVRVVFCAGGVGERSADDGFLHAVWAHSGPEDAGKPHVLGKAFGQGKYVGCYVAETSFDGSWWLLEGDERIEADGRVFAGTGMEDYFNGGWYYRGASFTPWSGILDREPFRVGQYRFHLTDPVPFAKRFEMTVERGDQNVSHGDIRSVAFFYLDLPDAVPDATVRDDLRAAENPLGERSLMLCLFELERCGDYGACIAQLDEWLEAHPGAPREVAGVLRLRRLEYRRLLEGGVPTDAMAPFLAGDEGEEARREAELLAWFYADGGENRALVGAANHAKAQVLVDGKPVEGRAHPLRCFASGVELAPGEHVLEVRATPHPGEPSPWVQAGVRTRGGFAGTGPGTAYTRVDGSTGRVIPNDVMRGPPHDETYMDAEPNAFVLLQGEAFGVRAADWDVLMDPVRFTVPFRTPELPHSPHTRAVMGVERPPNLLESSARTP